MNYDENEIRKTFSILCDGFTEVRLLKDKLTVSGYFSDVECLLKNLKKYSTQEGINCYIVLNKADAACYSRKQKDCFVEYPKETTSDANIAGRRWLMLDMDCDRPKGVSSSADEFEQARLKAGQVYKYMADNGFEKPVTAISGNGYHLLYRISLENNEVNTKLIKDCLIALDMMFSDDKVKIDTAVFNASRITKLYGTLAQKGQNTEDRPHRLSRIVDVPEEIKVTDVQYLVKLAEQIPEPPKEQPRQYRGTGDQFDLPTWLQKYGLRVTQEITTSTSRKFILEECPFNSEHRGKDAALFLMSSGAIGFKCLHSTCSRYNWQDVRKKFEPDAYDIKERIEPRVNSQKPKEELAPDEPFFYTASTIKPKDRSSIVSIRTGIRDLDKKIIGLNKGEVTCLSGVNASGKSSLLSQISLEVIQKGYRVALFSGELEENRVLNWIQLQAAGKQFTNPTQYEGFYTVDEEAKKHINKWLENKLYVYNNRKGSDITTVLKSVAECIKNKKIDFVVLDNLMSMDLTDIKGDKYEQQSRFIKEAMAFARNNDVHVVLIAHPRKTIGFLRKTDIAGTADLTNAVDNVLIVHRVNSDFKNLSKQEFHWPDTDPHYACSNVIEVCKNRDLGIQDHFIDLFYEVESKRFKNDPFEVRHYAWEDDMPCELPFDM